MNQEGDAWILLTAAEDGILAKMRQYGTPLKDMDVRINRGILTGCNEAFIIDRTKYDELVAADPKSAEVLKPLLRGEDIERYGHAWAQKYLIGALPALHLNIDDYPAIKEYLKTFGTKLEQTGDPGSRKKTNHKWFETQDTITYWQDFEKPKIIYPNMTLFLPFIYDDAGFYTNDKAFILNSEKVDLLFLLAVLNSAITHFWIRMSCAELQGGTRELRKIFMNGLPLPMPEESVVAQLAELARQIIELKTVEKDTSAQETAINRIVYGLYHLTEDEIVLVEEKKKKEI